MGHRQRVEARKRAWEKGEQAFRDGKPRDANPYKKPMFDRFARGSGGWSLHPSWDCGYTSAQQGLSHDP
jgi:hypothetical protein